MGFEGRPVKEKGSGVWVERRQAGKVRPQMAKMRIARLFIIKVAKTSNNWYKHIFKSPG